MLGKLKAIVYKYTAYGKTRYLNFLYKYDMRTYIENSGMNEANIENFATKMRLLSHAIEKGMSLPSCKLGFGKEKILELIDLYKVYTKCENYKDTQVLGLVRSIILEYISFQEENGLDVSFIPKEFRQPLCETIESGVMIVEGGGGTEFAQIATNRHSLRYYSEERVTWDEIYTAVKLAQTAPSACNRQATHVFACVDDKKIEEIIRMHGGIRGFGKPTVIFVITGNLNLYQNEYERNTVFVDGGIFLMNFLYALDSSGIAACPIIWGAEPSNDKRISDLLSIPESHKIISLVTAGYFPEGPYKVAKSPKRPIEDILHIVK